MVARFDRLEPLGLPSGDRGNLEEVQHRLEKRAARREIPTPGQLKRALLVRTP